jgi:hypothetical protein
MEGLFGSGRGSHGGAGVLAHLPPPRRGHKLSVAGQKQSRVIPTES